MLVHDAGAHRVDYGHVLRTKHKLRGLLMVDQCVNSILKVSCSQTDMFRLTVFAETFPLRKELVSLRFRVGLDVLDEAVLQHAPKAIGLVVLVF